MPTISFRKRQGLANVPRHALTQRVIPPFHMRRLSRLFADATMGFDRKDDGIRLPEIAETEASPILPRNSMPEAATGPFAVVANDEGNDLTRPTAQDGPQPPFPDPFAHKRPDFIDFQAVIGLRWLQGRPQGRQGVDFFLSTPLRRSGTRRRSG